MFKNTKRKVISGSVIVIIMYLIKARMSWKKDEGISPVKGKPKKKIGGQGNVDSIFF